jgi:uncharacterized protein (TIGR03086 family)
MARLRHHHGAMSEPITPTDAASSTRAPGGGGVPDPRPVFAAALDRAAAVMAAVGPESLADPTPCEEYTVEQLAGHLISVVQRLAAAARGVDLSTGPADVSGLAPAELVSAFETARTDQEASWADDEVLDRVLDLPFGSMPGQVILTAYVSEITVHTWDLATALGVEVPWDPAMIAGSLAVIRQALPADPRGAEAGIPFGPVVPTGPDASPLDQLVAWLGRDPAWSAR